MWGGLVFKAHRLLCHSALGLRVTKKKKRYLEDLARDLEESAEAVVVDLLQEVEEVDPVLGEVLHVRRDHLFQGKMGFRKFHDVLFKHTFTMCLRS